VLDKHVSGRIFFEQTIRDNLDIGRPDQVSLIFGSAGPTQHPRDIPHSCHHRHIPGMRFTDPRVQALLSTLCVFRPLPRGFINRDLRAHLAPQLGLAPEDMTSGQITYDLRRLRAHGLIQRIPRTHRYRVSGAGLRHALFLTRAHTRLLRTGLAEIHGPPVPTKLRAARRAYEAAMNQLTRAAGLSA